MAIWKVVVPVAVLAVLTCILLWYIKRDNLLLLEYTETVSNTGKPPRRVNTLVADYDVKVNRTLHELIQSGAGPRDPRVLNLIRYMLDPPSDHMLKRTKIVQKTPQLKEIETLVRRNVSSAKQHLKPTNHNFLSL